MQYNFWETCYVSILFCLQQDPLSGSQEEENGGGVRGWGGSCYVALKGTEFKTLIFNSHQPWTSGKSTVLLPCLEFFTFLC